MGKCNAQRHVPGRADANGTHLFSRSEPGHGEGGRNELREQVALFGLSRVVAGGFEHAAVVAPPKLT